MPRKRQGRRDFGCIIEHGPSSFSVTWAEGRVAAASAGLRARGKAEASFLAKARVDLETGERRDRRPIVVGGRDGLSTRSRRTGSTWPRRDSRRTATPSGSDGCARSSPTRTRSSPT